MRIFGGNKNKEKLILVFDIRSASVGGALFAVQESGIPKVLLTVREPIVSEETLNVDKFLSSTEKSLEIVVGKIYEAGLGKPEAIYCSLSPLWHFSQSRIIRLEKNVPFIFTPKLADDLIKKEIALFEEECLAKYKDPKNKVRSIEFKNIKTMLNSYETSNPLNQKVREVEMTIFISVSPEQVLNKIEETIGQCFHFKEIKFFSSTLASFALVRDIYPHNESFLLVDIGGEVTEITMAKKNILRESISFPLGINFMIRGVASLLNSQLSEAKSLLSLYKDGHATESVAKTLDPVVGKLKMDWLKKFQESLTNLTNDISIPANIYLIAEKEFADLFSAVIKTEQFNQYTLTESKFEIIPLDENAFNGMTIFKNDSVRDFYLMVGFLYIDRFLINSVTK